MTTRFFIALNKAERYALGKLAEKECRDLKQQAIWLIRRGLESEGYLQSHEAMSQMETAIEGNNDSAGV